MKRRLYIFMFLFTTAAGIFAFAGGEYLLQVMDTSPLQTAAYFSFVCIMLFVGVLASEALLQRFNQHRWRDMMRGAEKNLILLILGGCVLVFGLVFAMDSLYEHSVRKKTIAPDHYVLVLDSSASMSVSDPEQTRSNDLRNLLEAIPEDALISSYRITEGLETMSEPMLEKASFEFNPAATAPKGSSDAYAALSQLADQLPTNIVTRILFFTDGYGREPEFFRERAARRELTQRFRESGVSIAAIAYGEANYDFLKALTAETAGVYVPASEVDARQADVLYTSVAGSGGTMLQAAAYGRPVWLGILRVFCVTVAGGLMNLAALASVLLKINTRRVLAAVSKSLMAAAVLECGTFLFMPVARFVMCLLLCQWLMIYRKRENDQAGISCHGEATQEQVSFIEQPYTL